MNKEQGTEIKKSPSQTAALESLQQEGNFFLTGGAGTGKSFVIGLFKKATKNKDKEIRIRTIASTGAAAILVNGCTFHSYFGLGIGRGDEQTIISRACRNDSVVESIQDTDILIVDEVSMLNGSLLNLADNIAQNVRGNLREPFGGMKVIFVGDFFQLPPITESGQDPDWAFLSSSWMSAGVKKLELLDIMRTSDEEFMEILKKIRVGIVDQSVEEFLASKTIAKRDFNIEATRLYGSRKEVDSYNMRRLNELPGQARRIKTKFVGDMQFFENLKRNMPIPEELYIKPGALVMIRKNGVADAVNGTLAHVISINENPGERVTLTIKRLDNEIEYNIEPETFDWQDQKGDVRASAFNFPISLAWACTIHKSQGASIDKVYSNIARVWECGQAYVALSRAKNPEYLYIEDWTKKAIQAHPEVVSYYNGGLSVQDLNIELF